METALGVHLALSSIPTSTDPEVCWIADTGATSHMTPHSSWFVTYHPHIIPVHIANNQIFHSAGIGDVIITPTDTSLDPCQISHVLHVPNLQSNLFSVLHLVSHHCFRVEIEGQCTDFTQDGQQHFKASIEGNTAYMDVQTPPVSESALSAHAPLSRDLWHCDLCHIGANKLDQAIKHSVADGLQLNTQSPMSSLCEPCIHGKQHCDPFPHKASHWATQPLQCIHSDLHKVPCLTMSGYCYWVTFIDDYSCYCWIYLLPKKSNTLPVFKLFKALVEKQYGIPSNEGRGGLQAFGTPTRG
jgi:hypothetical protein